MKEVKRGNGSKTVMVALSLLDWFGLERQQIGLSEFVNLSKIPKANVLRHLTALEKSGLIKQNLSTKKYQLGFRTLELAYLVNKQFSLRNMVLPYMERIKEATNETVCLQIEDNGRGICIERLESSNKLAYLPPLGRREYLHAGASRKVLMAFMSDERIGEILNEKLEAVAPNTVTDPLQLRREIKSIREKGYAITESEHVDGVTAIATPIRDRNGYAVASLSVVGPTFRINEAQIEQYLECLMKATLEASNELGFQG